MGIGRIDLSDLCQEFITKTLPKDSTVLELGSGYGTKELVKNYTVYSVEQDLRWVNYCKESNYIYAPIVRGWYNTKILQEQLPSNYDMLIIDGPGGAGRSKFMENINLFPNIKNIPVIVDDANRDEEKILLEELSDYLNKPFTILEGDRGTAYFLP